MGADTVKSIALLTVHSAEHSPPRLPGRARATLYPAGESGIADGGGEGDGRAL